MTRSAVVCAVAGLFLVPSVAIAQRFTDVLITGGDYAYINAPQTLGAGLTAFSFENTGKVRHEMILVRLKPGITPDSAMRSRLAGALAVETSEPANGILIALPGTRTQGRLLVDLAAGHTYMLICNFVDAPDKPRHIALGMFSSFKVK